MRAGVSRSRIVSFKEIKTSDALTVSSTGFGTRVDDARQQSSANDVRTKTTP